MQCLLRPVACRAEKALQPGAEAGQHFHHVSHQVVVDLAVIEHHQPSAVRRKRCSGQHTPARLRRPSRQPGHLPVQAARWSCDDTRPYNPNPPAMPPRHRPLVHPHRSTGNVPFRNHRYNVCGCTPCARAHPVRFTQPAPSPEHSYAQYHLLSPQQSPTPPARLLDAIHVVAAGEALLTPSATRRLIEEFTRRPAPHHPPARILDGITDRERDVLLLVGRGLSNTEICQQLHISMATAKTHIGRLLTKLSARDRAQLVIAAYESGLINGTHGR